MSREPSERQKWFRSRIGKTIFRNENGCLCPVCNRVVANGLMIRDMEHADYLYDTECDYNRDGIPLRYFDTKQEVNEWLNTLQK